MATTEFSAAINQLAAERGISVDAILETVKQALIAAYKKDFTPSSPEEKPREEELSSEALAEEEIEIKLNPDTGEARVFKKGEDVTPEGFGRIAAQTAKQVILQRVREEEKSAIRGEFEKKQGSIVSGHIFRIEKGVVFVDLSRAQGILPPSEQIPREEFQPNQRVKVLVKEVREGPRGPEILLSRADPDLVKELFALEVPEIPAGVVKIELIAREAGQRTKMAVSSTEEKVDPVGSCVGQKGIRVQAVTRELGEEKVDIIPYSPDSETFVVSALSPARVLDVNLKKKSRTAEVEVPEDQLSLAIGKEGQNVRLAAKLTGWRIDIKGAGKVFAAETHKIGVSASELVDLGLSTRVVNALASAGISTLEDLKAKTGEELKGIKGLGPKALKEIKEALEKSGKTEAGESGKDKQEKGGAIEKDAQKEKSKQEKTEEEK
jgi:N utilization substance protein A